MANDGLLRENQLLRNNLKQARTEDNQFQQMGELMQQKQLDTINQHYLNQKTLVTQRDNQIAQLMQNIQGESQKVMLLENDKLNLQHEIRDLRALMNKVEEENDYLKKKNEIMNVNIVDQELLNQKIKAVEQTVEQKNNVVSGHKLELQNQKRIIQNQAFDLEQSQKNLEFSQNKIRSLEQQVQDLLLEMKNKELINQSLAQKVEILTEKLNERDIQLSEQLLGNQAQEKFLELQK